MGKVEDMRAMRERKWAERVRSSVDPAAAQERVEQSKAKRVGGQRSQLVVVDEVAVFSADVESCGHTSVGGKRCIRDKGHSEKSHRYAKIAKPA